jgi:hypothetical protein
MDRGRYLKNTNSPIQYRRPIKRHNIVLKVDLILEANQELSKNTASHRWEPGQRSYNILRPFEEVPLMVMTTAL